MAAVAKVMPLSLIGEELKNSIEQLETNLNSYIGDQSMGDMLQACIEQVDQLRGIFNLAVFVSAEALVSELLEMLKQAAGGESIDFAIVTKSISVLRRYLELMQNKDADLPELLIPIINELHTYRKTSPISEGCFLTAGNLQPTALANQKTEENVTPETIRRIRNMYQVGLTNVLREDNVPGSARMMLRSVENIQRYSGSSPFAYLWWVVKAVLTGISQEALSVTRPRKLLLGQLDRQFKTVSLNWRDALAQQPPENLIKELLFLVSLIQQDIGNVAAVKEAFMLPPKPSHKSLAKQQKTLMAMGAIPQAISERIKTQVAVVKELLETGTEQDHTIRFADILSHLTLIKDALTKSEMQKPLSVLDEQMMQVQEWQSSGIVPAREELIEMANSILYIESAISTGDMEEEGEESSDSFDEHKDKVIAHNQLAGAQQVLLVAAQTGLVDAIRAMTAYIESDYDKNSLSEVQNHLRSASGGLMFMKLDRGVRIIDACIAFFEKEVFASSENLSQQKLDTIADALTAMEYYLGGLMENKHYGEGMLDVAEDGLQTLGYLSK